MKFKVERTSMRYRELKPCEEAYEGNILWIGSDKYIKCWYVDINSLQELLDFEKKYGDIIITTSLFDNKTPVIEIYDYYRE